MEILANFKLEIETSSGGRFKLCFLLLLFFNSMALAYLFTSLRTFILVQPKIPSMEFLQLHFIGRLMLPIGNEL